MARHIPWATIPLLLIALGGCIGGSPQADDATDEPDDPDPGTGGDPGPGGQPGNVTIPVGNATYPQSVVWRDCTGFVTLFEWPGSKPPGVDPPPDEWGEDPTHAVTDVLIQNQDCNRVSWGHFERPMHTALEWHNYQDQTDDCWRTNATAIHYTLQAIYIDDAEVADFIREMYGITVHLAEFETDRVNVTGGAEYVWRMKVGENPWTEVRSFERGEHDTDYDIDNRLFWFPERGGVGVMDWDIVQQDGEDSKVSYGTMSKPLIMSDWPTDYAGPSDNYLNGHFEGKIQMYEDLFCEQPV